LRGADAARAKDRRDRLVAECDALSRPTIVQDRRAPQHERIRVISIAGFRSPPVATTIKADAHVVGGSLS
jgi:hypothetical protein